MKQSESITKLLENFANAQGEFVTLPKDKQGYGYKYTDLDTVISTVRPILAKHGLGFIQSLTTTESGKNAVTTRLFSKEGEYLEDTIILPDISMAKTNSAQNLGAAITYMKRYALCAMLGISSDEDTDAETQRILPNSQTAQKQNLPRKEPPKVQQKQRQTGPAGGPDTNEQRIEINNLLSATYQDNTNIFSQELADKIPSWRKVKTADEVIHYLKGEIARLRQERASKEEDDSPSFEEMNAIF